MKPLGTHKISSKVSGHQHCSVCHPDIKGGRSLDKRTALKQFTKDEEDTMSGYVVLKRPGKPATIDVVDGSVVSYDTLKSGVDDGFIAVAHAEIDGNTVDIWCDDEGILKKLPINFWHSRYQQEILGPVIVCACDAEGESIPLSKTVAESIAKWLDQNSYNMEG